ncbi:MAG: bifunctional adenosylcobinamide kinase/adenosylcobinamide-phosphate guanylyltransferase [Lachnospiraceae bacterium]|nr:bifunctional adenosylcobinamide kinase/adenosylcobinamide-phosphate guanylyltransferase [Lachnospiraceae bacterium]
MMTLIYGGSGSGKSAFAESYLLSRAEGRRKYYLATMQVYDEEGQRKVERHRRLRKDKGFTTIEQPTEIQNAVLKMAAGEKTALLECIGNLTANEMFSRSGQREEAEVVEEILKGISVLKEELVHLVVVSNNVFEDGRSYEEATMRYIHTMGRLNVELAALADEVIEVVAGIPVTIQAV